MVPVSKGATPFNAVLASPDVIQSKSLAGIPWKWWQWSCTDSLELAWAVTAVASDKCESVSAADV